MTRELLASPSTRGRKRAATASAIGLAAAAALTLGPGTGGGVGAANASDGIPIYGQCTGAQSGVIKGDVVTKGQEGKWAISSLTHGIVSPRDPASGQATGRRQHKPITFTMEVSPATTKLIDALINNENLTSCTFNFWRNNPDGSRTNYFRIALKNAAVINYDLKGAQAGDDSTTFALNFQTITWTFIKGGLETSDSLNLDQ